MLVSRPRDTTLSMEGQAATEAKPQRILMVLLKCLTAPQRTALRDQPCKVHLMEDNPQTLVTIDLSRLLDMLGLNRTLRTRDHRLFKARILPRRLCKDKCLRPCKHKLQALATRKVHRKDTARRYLRQMLVSPAHTHVETAFPQSISSSVEDSLTTLQQPPTQAAPPTQVVTRLRKGSLTVVMRTRAPFRPLLLLQ